MKTIITQLLQKGFPNQQLQFKTIFINGLTDENDQVVLGMMKPRFVHLYSDKMSKITEALFLCRKLLGDAFDYEVHEFYTLPEESEEVDISLHERSRILNADDFCKVFANSTPEESIQYLLKSTILITVNTFTLKGHQNAYTCDLNVRPTIAKITPPDQNRISFASPYTSIETTVRFDDYESLVDKSFDSVGILYNDKMTEFQAPETTMELLNIAKKLVLGETYKDEFISSEK